MVPISDPEEAAAVLAAMVRDADVVTGFTGAGISTESGVPDFRSPGSPWKQNKPIPYDAFVASAEARQEAWRRKFTMDDTYAGARPGRGHLALAALHRSGRMPILITQNIDGLHHESGIAADSVIELHGNGTYAACIACATRHELHDIRAVFERDGHPPPCRACGGMLKSATVSFGQPMPELAMRRAVKATLACDLFLAIGSSLVVFPAAGLPRAARENGAKLVILNGEETALDSIADLVIRSDIGTVLSGMQSSLDHVHF
jgi:NAD-dependent deacetylase